LGAGDEPSPVPSGQPQDEVGNREIRQQRPLGSECGQMLDVGNIEIGPFARQSL
jgi:hypothetical protein